MSLMLFACGQQNAKNNNATTVTASKPAAAATNVPEFNADSAYTYVEKQVAFGPRVPNSEAHKGPTSAQFRSA